MEKEKSVLPPKRGQFFPTSFELVRSFIKHCGNSSQSLIVTTTVVDAPK